LVLGYLNRVIEKKKIHSYQEFFKQSNEQKKIKNQIDGDLKRNEPYTLYIKNTKKKKPNLKRFTKTQIDGYGDAFGRIH
jgi:hypothetical protein